MNVDIWVDVDLFQSSVELLHRIGRPRHGAMPIPYPQTRPSYPPSESTLDEEEESAMIQEEWEESLRQLEVVISIVLIPFFGKWYGRRFSWWGGFPFIALSLWDLC